MNLDIKFEVNNKHLFLFTAGLAQLITKLAMGSRCFQIQFLLLRKAKSADDRYRVLNKYSGSDSDTLVS